LFVTQRAEKAVEWMGSIVYPVASTVYPVASTVYPVSMDWKKVPDFRKEIPIKASSNQAQPATPREGWVIKRA